MFCEKIKHLSQLAPDFLGLFFDDMKSSEGMAQAQIEMTLLARENTKAQILFCPSYYSDDHILDKVFGERPKDYLKEISNLPEDVEIMWTGEKVISQEISESHM